MRTGTVAVLLAGLIAASGITYAFLRGDGAAPGPVSLSPAGGPVEVNDLAVRPEDFAGELTLRAAVARVSRSKGVLSVIDAREFEKCGCLDCAEHYLPVKIAGPLPEPRAIVTLTGRVVRAGDGLVFEASRLEEKK